MKEWSIQIVGVVILTTIISILLPNNSCSKFIKSIFSTIIIFVLIQPVFNFIKTGVLFTDFSFNNEIIYQQDFITKYSDLKINNYEENCLKILNNNGINDAKIKINYAFDKNYQIKISNVEIFISNTVINEVEKHKYIIEKTINEISTLLNIKNENIVIYE